ncbi:sensor histidine kinase [Bizionia sp.]|uniref:ATP-binding protein n=1 Tax=Bizionia sp. TaxID=1954480 RepID=UPI003A918644
MKKILLVPIALLLGFYSFSQTQVRYLDSLGQTLHSLSEANQLQAINKIPYDKFVGDVRTSENLFFKGVDLAIKLEDSTTLGDIYLKLGQIYAYKENFEKRTEYVLKSIKIYESLGKHVKAGIAYGQLGYNLKYSDMENALRYMRKGIKLLEQEKNTTEIDPLYDNYGIVLTINKKRDSALFYTKKSLNLKKKLKDSVGLGYGYANVATVYADDNKLELAKIYIDSSSAVRTKIKDSYGIAVNYTHLADVLLKQNLFSDAIKNYQISASIAKKGKYKGLERYCYESISNAYVQMNDYKQAYLFGKKFQTLKDSVLNTETSNKVEQLKIEFETEKKENEILLQRADLAEKERDISEKNSFILGLAGLAAVISLLGFLVYNQQKLKNKQLKKEGELKEALVKIETQNHLQEQRLRISRDLHDNIGAQLTFIISSLDNLKYGFKLPDNLNAKLENISQFTTSTIYELRDTIWAMNKSEISIEDLQSRISNFIEKANTSSDAINFNFQVNKEVNSNKLFTSVQGMNIYRIIQEAVNNALKYANATVIDVQIFSKNDDFELIITDNGTGFNIKDVTDGNGLQNIKKRAHDLNAKLDIISSENQGTKIHVYRFENT